MKLSLNLRCLPDQPEEDAFWSYFASQLGRIDLMRLGIHVPETLHPVKRNTVFENHRKSLIQHCERSELRLHFEWTKVH